MAAFLYRVANDGPAPVCFNGPYPDVPVGAAFCGEIAWLSFNDIVNGYPDGTFKPTAPVSRQAMAAFLHRLYAYQHAWPT